MSTVKVRLETLAHQLENLATMRMQTVRNGKWQHHRDMAKGAAQAYRRAASRLSQILKQIDEQGRVNGIEESPRMAQGGGQS